MSRKHSYLLATLLLLLLPLLAAGDGERSRAEVEAGIIHNLTRFVKWPTGTFPKKSDPLIVGFFGDTDTADALKERLNAASGKRGRPVEVRKLRVDGEPTPKQLEGCHVVFVVEKQRKWVAKIVELLKDKRVLTVSPMTDFARAGGCVELPLENKKVKIVINRTATKKRGFKVHSGLLKLAKVIENGNEYRALRESGGEK